MEFHVQLREIVSKAREATGNFYNHVLGYVARNLPDDKIREAGAYQELKKRNDFLSERLTGRLKIHHILADKYRELSEQYEEVILDRQRKFVELASIRMGKGYPASSFSCPEAAGEIAKRSEDLRIENAQLEGEVASLKQAINTFSNRFYESIFDAINVQGLIPKNAALLFISDQGKILRVSESLDNLLGIKSAELCGESFMHLYSPIPDRKIRRRLIDDWRTDELKYREVITPNGDKLDVLVQRADYEDGTAGAFVYISRHNILRRHNKVSSLVEGLRGVGESLHGHLSGGYLNPSS